MFRENNIGTLRVFFTGANASESVEDLVLKTPLAQATIQLGHQIVESYMDADVVICIDFQYRFRSLLRAARRVGAFTVLVKQEPPVVFPEHNSSNPHDLFDLVITRGVAEKQGLFNTHQLWDKKLLPTDNRLSRAVAISANKWSADPRELYSLRREVYSSDPRVDVFGGNWDKDKFWTIGLIAKESLIQMRSRRLPSIRSAASMFKAPINYKGLAASKANTLAKYKASVVIENYQGYMSEKLVDSILCGTIPIYVGPDPLAYGIPRELYIYSDPYVESIRAGISKALAKNYGDYLEVARDWSNSPGIRENWIGTAVSERLIEFVRLNFLKKCQEESRGVK